MTTAILIPPRPRKPATAPAGRAFAYLRVSSDEQDVAAQKVGIVDFCRERDIRVDEWFEETASGGLDASQRDLGQKLIPKLKAGDTLIASEISRLGRSTVDVLSTLKQLSERGIKGYICKGSLVLDDSLNSKILGTVLGLAAEIERELIRQRTREGLARAKASGKHIGRPRIEREEDHRSKLDKHADEIKRNAAKGVTKLNLARFYDCDWATMDLWLKRHGVTIAKK